MYYLVNKKEFSAMASLKYSLSNEFNDRFDKWQI